MDSISLLSIPSYSIRAITSEDSKNRSQTTSQ